MLPFLEVPIGRGVGLLLLAVALGLWAVCSRTGAAAGERARRPLALLPGLAGLALLALGQVASVSWPVYGLLLATASVAALAVAARWAPRRGVSPELILELGVLGLVCGLVGARAMFLTWEWDRVMADRPPAMASAGPRTPLEAGDTLLLRSHAGLAEVTFRGDERGPEAAAARIAAEAGARDVVTEVQVVRRPGPEGTVVTVRGFVLRTGQRGPAATLEVLGGEAAEKLGLPIGRTQGLKVPWQRALDLRQGGLTYYGALLAVLLSCSLWLRYRGAPALTVLDLFAPLMPLGQLLGRLGCLAQGCCFGREAGPDAPLGLGFPPWSIPWRQHAAERVTCDLDPLLNQRELTPELERLLGDLVGGTPHLHPTQLYEAAGLLLVGVAVWVFRERWQRRAGQAILLALLLQAPLRFVVDHFRGDHTVSFPLLGYPFTESQLVASALVAAALPAFVWVSRRGQPPAEAEAPAGGGPPEGA